MPQVGLKGLLEFTAACGFLFAMSTTVDLVSYALACGVVAMWSLRITSTSIRWWIFSWLIGCFLSCVGLACLEQGLTIADPDQQPADYWLLLGCGAIVLAPLAIVIGAVFLADWIGRDRVMERKRRAHVARARALDKAA